MHLRVYGIPAAQGSKKAVPVYAGSGPDRHPTGKVNLLEMAGQKLADWRAAIRDTCARALESDRDHAILTGPVSVMLQFYLPRPAGHYGTGKNCAILKPSAPELPSGKRNDLDKLERAALDALTQGGAWHDDGQVALVVKGRYYASRAGEAPGAVDCPAGVEIWTAPARLPTRMRVIDTAAAAGVRKEGS